MKFEYQGYYTELKYSTEDKCYHGRIEGIKDLVSFEFRDIADAEREFRLAVDDYLAYCDDLGVEPSLTCR